MIKEDFKNALQTLPDSVESSEEVFPILTIPSMPTTIQEAIIASGKCLCEQTRWLNAFQGMLVREVIGASGNLNNSISAIALSQLNDSGEAGTPTSWIDYISVPGLESEGGRLGYKEPPALRSGSFAAVDLITTALALFPDSPMISNLTSMVVFAETLYSKPFDIAIECGEIILFQVLDLIKLYIADVYFPRPDQGTIPECVCENLAGISNHLAEIQTYLSDARNELLTIRKYIKTDAESELMPSVSASLDAANFRQDTVIVGDHTVYKSQGIVEGVDV